MSEFTPSRYSDAPNRPFGAFVDDMTADQLLSYQETLTLLSGHSVNEEMERFRQLFYNALSVGFVTHDEYDAWEDIITDRSNRVAAWYDRNTKNLMVLEYNEVRGVVVRKYRVVKFIEKLLKTYRTYAYGEEPLVPENVAPYVTQLFPNLDKYSIEVWGTPSDMYDEDTMGHTNSCMVGTEYVRFYDTAPAKGLVVRNPKGAAIARTLLWTLNDGRRVIDRIYTTDGVGLSKIHYWARENGVLLEFPEDAHVTAPIHKGGHPYMDNLSYWVRIGDTAHLFSSYAQANTFLRSHPDAVQQVFDTTETGGGPEELYEELVQYKGSWVSAYILIERDGKTYLLDDLPNLRYAERIEEHRLYRTWDSQNEKYIAVYGYECFQYRGEWYAVSEHDGEYNGQRVPAIRMFPLVRIVDDVLDFSSRIVDQELTEHHESLGYFLQYSVFALNDRRMSRRIRSRLRDAGVSEAGFVEGGSDTQAQIWAALVEKFGGEA